MSALGQKQTLEHDCMSALPPKAAIDGAMRNVRFVPKADSCAASKPSLFDHLVGAEQNVMILSHGAVSNWVMLDWWSSHILYHRISRVEGMPPERFIDAPFNLFQCVYELRITAFESEAWRKNVVEDPSPDIHAYLKAQLNIDV
jgi:hypothetical protein